MYINGIETKQNIYLTAKNLFYELGYQKTTIRLISEHANVPIGLTNYHFKNKENIVKQIYSEYIDNILTFLDAEIGDKLDSFLLRQITSLRIYYNNILIDKNNLHFVVKNSSFEMLYNRVDVAYQRILDENNIILPREIFKSYIIAEFGARQELLLRYYSKQLDLSIQELVDTISCIAPRLFEVDHKIVDNALKESLILYNSIDASGIKFLI
jgi:AcrR family transcriptional regulator